MTTTETTDRVAKIAPKNLLKGFKKPKKIAFLKDEENESYGKFTAEPFEKGLGTTIGNSLRRILMSSIEGSAITAIKIEGVSHEFDSIPGMREDVPYFLLNLKKIALDIEESMLTIDIRKKGAGILLASDLEVSSSIKILNPGLVLAHLNEDADISFNLQLSRGKGYVPSEVIKKSIQEVGVIALDAFFSPIKRVNFEVSETRVDQRTDYDKLMIELETDGSIMPADAIAYSAKILKEYLTYFINFDESSYQEEDMSDEFDEQLRLMATKDLEELDLSVRTLTLVRSLDLHTIHDLCLQYEENFRKSKYYSDKVLLELKTKLASLNLTFGMRGLK